MIGANSLPLVFAAGEAASPVFTGSGITLAIGTFASVSGSFSFAKTDTIPPDGRAPTKTVFEVSGTSAFVGVEDGSTGITLTGASLGLLLEKDGSLAKYALVAK